MELSYKTVSIIVKFEEIRKEENTRFKLEWTDFQNNTSSAPNTFNFAMFEIHRLEVEMLI